MLYIFLHKEKIGFTEIIFITVRSLLVLVISFSLFEVLAEKSGGATDEKGKG